MNDQRKTKAHLSKELEVLRGEVTDLRGENTTCEKAREGDVSGTKRGVGAGAAICLTGPRICFATN